MSTYASTRIDITHTHTLTYTLLYGRLKLEKNYGISCTLTNK